MGILLGTLWIAGGASRADAIGQIVVRAVAWTLLVIGILFGERPSLQGVRPVLILLTAALLLALIQMVPLPPGLWQAMPGRGVLAEAAAASGQPQPWRPWSIVPGATFNAASSLVVPFVTLLFAAGLKQSERALLPGLLLGLVAASFFVGLLQFATGGLHNPFVNDTPGEVSGTFANRNHFALFLALGCILAPLWAFFGGRLPGWRAPLALGLTLVFALMLLVTGSRAGLVLGAIALATGLPLVSRGLRRELRHYPRWTFPVLVFGLLALVAIVVLASVAADRAVSIDRILEVDQGQEMRVRGLPTVLAMIHTYFPFGSGLGGFDPLFRMHEPFELLKLTFFNHAHNDVIEVVLDAGLAGACLLACAVGWWGWASVRAWRAGPRGTLAQAGSAILLLNLLASLVDYPVRTPAMMAMVVIAAVWLSDDGASAPR
ncbi:O-antigen ligase family protein [uncultured Sphingomonas sp.]|uniref:O-antigen ligase family protein n=1 Tax=uncultured Sphingomonas sp. TaxID=158754 RepID=UPI0035C9A147